MKHLMTLYTGSAGTDSGARQMLRQWSAQRNDIVFTVESIHANPSEALRLQITQLPALVLEGMVVAQGPPEDWLSRLFLDRLLAP